MNAQPGPLLIGAVVQVVISRMQVDGHTGGLDDTRDPQDVIQMSMGEPNGAEYDLFVFDSPQKKIGFLTGVDYDMPLR